MNVLLIDDDMGSLQGMSMALQLIGHNCEAYNNPTDALYYYDGEKFDVVITDLQMPVMNGIQLMVAIREINPSVPVIIISGYASQRWVEECLERGAAAFLNKPIDVALLSKVLDKISIELDY